MAPTSSSRSSGTARTTTTAKRSTPPTNGRLAPADAVTDLPTVTLDELPSQAITTLRLIAAGGPFPYRQDGVVFENRERHLPRQRSGYYHEYTVVTPGSPDRGARRIIAGTSGERFYTADHYSSFREVIQP